MRQGHPRSLTVSVIELSEITSKLEHVGKQEVFMQNVFQIIWKFQKKEKNMQCAIFKALAPSGRRLACFIRTKPSQELSTIFQ